MPKKRKGPTPRRPKGSPAAKDRPDGPGRAYIFCGATPTTNEHFIPRWISEVLRRPGVHWHMVPTSTRSDWKPRAPRIGKEMDQQVRVVCQKVCNGGWMAELEITDIGGLRHRIV